MNLIKINARNKGAINAEIDKAEGRATRRLSGYDDCVRAKRMAREALICQLLSASELDGAVLYFFQGAKLPKSYEYTAEATGFSLVHQGGKWMFRHAFRHEVKRGYDRLVLQVYEWQLKRAQVALAATAIVV